MKRLLGLSLIGVMIFSLSACGGVKETSESETPTEETTVETTIEVSETGTEKDIPDEHFDDNGEYVMETDLYDENGAVIRKNTQTDSHIDKNGSKNN